MWVGADAPMNQKLTLHYWQTSAHNMCLQGLTGKCLIWNTASPQTQLLTLTRDLAFCLLIKRSQGPVLALRLFGVVGPMLAKRCLKWEWI